MSDIVERLRARDAYLSLDEADDEIERLRGLLQDASDTASMYFGPGLRARIDAALAGEKP